MKKIAVLALILPMLATLCLLLVYFSYFPIPLSDTQVLAQFGDYLGGIINPILGFCAIILILYTVQLQLIEIRATKEELSLSRKALQQQKSEIELSREALQQQAKNQKIQFVRDDVYNLISESYSRLKQIESRQILFKEGNGKDCFVSVAIKNAVRSNNLFNQLPMVFGRSQQERYTKMVEELYEDLSDDFKQKLSSERKELKVMMEELADLIVYASRVLVEYKENGGHPLYYQTVAHRFFSYKEYLDRLGYFDFIGDGYGVDVTRNYELCLNGFIPIKSSEENISEQLHEISELEFERKFS